MDKVFLKIIFVFVLVAGMIALTKPAPPANKLEGTDKQIDSESSDASFEETPASLKFKIQEQVHDQAGLPEESKSTKDQISMTDAIRQVESILPQTGQLKFSSPEAAHHIHPAVLRAGIELGQLKEKWLLQPQQRDQVFKFYEECTFNVRVAPSVRALCYINAIEISMYLKKTDQVLAWNLDDSVQNLASRLMSN